MAKIKREELPKIAEIIRDADELMGSFQSYKDHTEEENRERCFDYIEEGVLDGTFGQVEGMVMLASLGWVREIPGYFQEQLQINYQAYPQFDTVDRAMARRMETAPMCALLDSFVTEDFLESYCKRSISIEELVYRLAMLGRIPKAEYLRMTPKERRKQGTDVDLIQLW